jgi:hypothetical protein
MATTCKLIAKNVLGSDTASVTFSSIPQTYTDLVVVGSVRTDRASQYVDIVGVKFNGNTSNYSDRNLYGDVTTAKSTSNASGAYGFGWLLYANGPSSTADTFGSSFAYIPNYAGSTNKSYSSEYATESNSSTQNHAFIGALAGLWANTSAITSMDLIPGFGTNFKSGSSFFLYGILKA